MNPLGRIGWRIVAAGLGILLVHALPAAAAAPPCDRCPAMTTVPPSFAPDTGIDGFLMTTTEVTFDQWQACVEDGACRGGQDDHGWGRGDRPVINVSWQDGQDYAAWLGGRMGRACRLPAEREWEHAARGGRATRFWWGDTPGSGMANCRDCGPAPLYGTRPVGSYPANPFGLHDMSGNVWEWAEECWSATDCRRRVIKGGAWYYYARNAEIAARAPSPASLGSYTIGLRILCR